MPKFACVREALNFSRKDTKRRVFLVTFLTCSKKVTIIKANDIVSKKGIVKSWINQQCQMGHKWKSIWLTLLNQTTFNWQLNVHFLSPELLRFRTGPDLLRIRTGPDLLRIRTGPEWVINQGRPWTSYKSGQAFMKRNEPKKNLSKRNFQLQGPTPPRSFGMATAPQC